jgi:hypothetical protein
LKQELLRQTSLHDNLNMEGSKQCRGTPMIAETLIISLAIFVVAFFFAPIGMGGGMLFVPLLHYGLGWEINGALFAVSLSLSNRYHSWSGHCGAHRK